MHWFMNRFRRLLLMILCLLAPIGARADFVVQDIQVNGLQRISAGTVLNYLPVSVGSLVREQDYPEIIRALFRTGFFTDVRLERNADVLVVVVTERPAIAQINVSGNQDLGTDDINEFLKEQGLIVGEVFNRSTLDKAEQELIREYFNRGKYAAKVDSRLESLPRNRVAINLEISEGVAARIRQVNIVGNQAFDDDELLDELQLDTTGMFSFFTEDDQYSKQKLAADIETLRSFYLDQGYVKFNVNSTQVSITPDKKDIYITLNITEGGQYRVRGIELAGDLIVPEEELRKLITIEDGDIFSRSAMTAVSQRISGRLGDDGYAFANVNTVPDVNEEAGEVSLTFVIDPGRRVYVRRINFSGNIKTHDEVLRRELRQVEGSWYSNKDIDRSKTRLERLRYLEGVEVETKPVPGTTDQVDVSYQVAERASGNLVVGAGFGQDAGVLLNTSINQDNFLGTGNQVAISFNNSDIDTIYSFVYTNPYYTLDGISRGFRLTYQEEDVGESNVADYLTDSAIAQINYGIPLNEFDSVRLAFGLEGLKVKTASDTPDEIFDFLDEYGDDYLFFKTELSWSRDSRNRAIFADRGSLNQLSSEIALPGSDLEFYKLSYRYLGFFGLTRSLTLSVRGDLALGDGYGDLDDLPFFENYFAGGLRTVRGYKSNTLGPRFSNDEPSGGSFRTVAGTELIFPVPFLKDSKSFRLSGFFDIGNVFASVDDFEAGDLRYSAGVSVMWLSPLGPLALSLAQPLNDEEGDEVEEFQFSFGVPF